MSHIAYVNGRYLPAEHAAVSIEDRGYQFADGVYEVCEVRAGRLIDERRHMARLDRSLNELRIPRPMSPAALSLVLHEVVRRNRVRDGIVYLQVTRGVARRDFPFPPDGTPPTLVVTARSTDPARLERLAAEGIAVVTVPDIRWGRVDIKTVALLPNVLAKQAAREQGAREAWLVDARRPRHRGRLVQCLDRQPRRRADHPPARPRHPARHHPLGGDRRRQGAGAHVRGARLHGRGGLCRARGLRHLGQPDRAAGREHRRPPGRQRRARPGRHRAYGAIITATPRSPEPHLGPRAGRGPDGATRGTSITSRKGGKTPMKSIALRGERATWACTRAIAAI